MGAMWTFDQHQLSFEEPDMVWLAIDGQLDVKHLQEMIALVREFKARQDRDIYLVVDARKGLGFTPAARKAISDNPDLVPYAGTVFFGTSFGMKTFVNMLSRARELLGRQETGNVTVFVDTADEARAWVATRRGSKAKASAS